MFVYANIVHLILTTQSNYENDFVSRIKLIIGSNKKGPGRNQGRKTPIMYNPKSSFPNS
jgi:hypothetical protein